MRQTLMVATMAVLMSCSPDGNTPWDSNHDGVITACEGLNSYTCDATPGCEPVPTRCATSLVAETDGDTRCLGAETCRPTTPPIFDCSRLSLSDCATVARCEVVTRQTACETNGGVGFAEPSQRDPAPAPAPPLCGQAVQVCVNRAPTACEQLSNDVCLAQPGCALQGSGSTCDVACSAEAFNCPPCATEVVHCVTLPPPDVCGARDANSCTLDGRCVLETADYRCDTASPCAPNDPTCGAPISCSPPAPRCVPAPPPDVCGSRDENTCSIDGRCVLELAVCATVCDPDGSCPPCANPTPRCVPAPVPGLCDGRDANTCALDGQCMLLPGPECLCSPDGTCPPCASPSVMCVPVPVTDECASRDLNTCAMDGRCLVQAWACPAVCMPDGNGGCLPCDAPPAACVPAYPVSPDPDPQPSRCAGLDRLTCAAAGCELVELDCAQVCLDDGRGGCLPCVPFVCNDPSTGSGGGTPPPQP